MRYVTAKKRVEGLGTAHSGTHHFIEQRLSAIALVFLIPLFLIFVAPYLFDDPSEVVLAFRECIWVGLIAAGTLIFAAMHLTQGLQVVIEDYVPGVWRVLLLAAMRIGIWILTLSAVWAIVLLSL